MGTTVNKERAAGQSPVARSVKGGDRYRIFIGDKSYVINLNDNPIVKNGNEAAQRIFFNKLVPEAGKTVPLNRRQLQDLTKVLGIDKAIADVEWKKRLECVDPDANIFEDPITKERYHKLGNKKNEFSHFILINLREVD